MSGLRKLKHRMLDLDTFYHLEDLLLYVWILLNALDEDGVQVGCVVPAERKNIRMIRKFGENLWYCNGKKIDGYLKARLSGWRRRSIREWCVYVLADKGISLVGIISIGWECL
jgi:hypothetical protein